MTRARAIMRIVIAVVFIGAVVGAGTALPRSEPADDPPRGTPAPVLDATLVCPESRHDEATETSAAAVALPSELAGAAGRAGEASSEEGAIPAGLDLTDLGAAPDGAGDEAGDDGASDDGEEGADRGRADRRGVVARRVIDAEDAPPVIARASGPLAPGATAGQLTRTATGELRGLDETPCARPGSEFWFVGAGSQVGRHGRLYLTNPEQVPARLSLSLYDETGPIGTESTRNITLEPNSQQILELDEFAPGSERLAVHVDITQGRAAAALRDDLANDGVPLGVDWIPPSTRPATDVVVPAVAPGEGRRVLSVFVPGELAASVDVEVMGANGTFQPMEQGVLESAPGTVTELDLTEVLAGEAAALRLSSDEPVVASVRSEFGPADGRHDITHSSGAEPLTGPAAIPYTPAGEDTAASLLLSSVGDQPGRATVAVLNDAGEEVDAQEVTITPNGTVEHTVELPDTLDAYTIMVTPEPGSDIYGSRLLLETLEEPLASLWPLSTAPLTVTRPAVGVDPRAGL